MIIKILATIVILILYLLQYFLDHKYHDKRKNNYKVTKNIFITVFIMAIIFSIVTTVLDSYEQKSLRQDIHNLNSNNSLREENAKLERKNLVQLIDKMSGKLKPFEMLAITQYPNLSSDEALLRFSNRLINIEFKTENLINKTTELEQRTLSDNFKEIILESLKNCKKGHIRFINNNSKESLKYTYQFEELFEKLGWEVSNLDGFGERFAHKMSITLGPKHKELAAFDSLVNSLHKCGIDFIKDGIESDWYECDIIFDAGTLNSNQYQAVVDKRF